MIQRGNINLQEKEKEEGKIVKRGEKCEKLESRIRQLAITKKV